MYISGDKRMFAFEQVTGRLVTPYSQLTERVISICDHREVI